MLNDFLIRKNYLFYYRRANLEAKRIDYTYRSIEDTFRLYHLTDMHVGAAACDEKLLEEDVAFIAEDPNAIVFLGGDQIDGIIPPDNRRYDPLVVAEWGRHKLDIIGAEVDRVAEILSPIASKIVAVASGNHEEALHRFHNRYAHGEVLKELSRMTDKTPQELDLTHRGFVTLAFKRGKSEKKAGGTSFITIYMCHGVGGGSLHGGHALTLGRLLDNYACDLALMGHRHVSLSADKTVTSVNRAGTKIITKTRTAVLSPSYLQTWIEGQASGKYDKPITYSDRMEYPAVPLGVRPIVIRPYTGAVDVIKSNVNGLKNMAVKIY